MTMTERVIKKILFSRYFLMGILLIFWGSFCAISKLALKELDSYQLQFYLFGISFMAMVPGMFAKKRISNLLISKPKEIIKVAGLGIPCFLYYFFYTLSLKSIPAIEASMLNYLFPVFIMLLAVPVNKEKLTGYKALSAILGFLGMIIIISNGNLANISLTNIEGDVLAVIAAVSWALFSTIGKENKVDMYTSNFVIVTVCFILSGITLNIFSTFVLIKPLVIIAMLWLSLSNIVLSNFIWFNVLKTGASSAAASMTFITPFITVLFIVILLDEEIRANHLAGFAIIIGGIIVQRIPGMISLRNKTIQY